MRAIFVGSQELGYRCLKELLKEDEVVAVFTISPEKHEKWNDDVKLYAEGNKIPLFVDEDMNDYIEEIREMNPDVIFVMGWRKIISKEVLDIPKLGCFGIHCSLLPKYRGNAPFTWPIISGDTKTGTSLFEMAETADTGPIVIQKECAIFENDTGGSLRVRLFNLSVEMLREVLPLFRENKIPLKPQKDEDFSYFGPRKPEDGVIDWDSKTKEVYDFIRALAPPFPMAFTHYKSNKIYIPKASIIKGYYGVPSSVIAKIGNKLVVGTKDGAIIIEEMIAEGDFNIKHIKSGEKFSGNLLTLTEKMTELEGALPELISNKFKGAENGKN